MIKFLIEFSSMAERNFFTGESAELFGQQKLLRPLSGLFARYFLSPYQSMGINPATALPDPAQFRMKAGQLIRDLERGENPLGQFCTEESGVNNTDVESMLVGKGKFEYLALLLDLPKIAQKIFGADYAARLQYSIHSGVLDEIPEVEIEG